MSDYQEGAPPEALHEVPQLLELELPLGEVLVHVAAVVDEPELAVLGRAAGLFGRDDGHHDVRPIARE